MVHSVPRWPVLLTLLVAGSVPFAAMGARPSEELLPNTTKAYVSIDNLDELSAAWKKTQLGQLVNDPVMKPFVEDLQRQLKTKFSQTGIRLGLSWEDLNGVASGEVAVASIQPAGDKSRCATVLLADVTGHGEKAQQLLDKIGKNLVQKGATQGRADIGGVTFSAFKLAKKKPTDRPITAFYTIHQSQLIAVDDVDVAAEMIKHFEGTHTTSLQSLPAFKVSLGPKPRGLSSGIRRSIGSSNHLATSRLGGLTPVVARSAARTC